jgi:hypothetical protein
VNNAYFRYPEFDDPILEELKKLAATDVADCTRDFSKVRVICGYVHTLFEHDGDN